MRTFLRGKLTLLFMTFAVLLAVPAVAFAADNVVSDGDVLTAPVTDQDMAAGSVPCNSPTTKQANVALRHTGGANSSFKNGSTVTVTAQAAGPGLSAQMNSSTITLPSNWESSPNGTLSPIVSSQVTINPSVTGQGGGTVTYTATGTGSDNQPFTRSDTMNVTWTAGSCDSTAPVITPDVQGTLGNNGWYRSNVTVSWNVNDPESSVTSTNGCGTTSVTSDTAGVTFTCQATSAGGTDSKSVTIKRDATPPQVTLGGVSGTVGNNGWYKSVVTQTFNASDATSDLAGPSSFTRSSGANEEGSNVSIGSGPVLDNAGNTASASAGPFKIDLTPPTITASLSPQNPALSGWYNAATGAPTVSFTCNDSVSGLDASACPASHTFGNGANQSHSGTVTDRAGHSATDGVSNVDVDLDAPNAPTATTDPANPVANSGGFFKDLVKVSYGGSTDVGPSGIKGYTAVQSFSTTGTHNYSGTATDNAGNVSAATTGQVKVDADAPTLALSGCPTAPVTLNDTKSISFTASDEANGSGLVGASSGSVSLDTSVVGPQSKSVTVEDKVGHTTSKTCTYSVKYGFSGFLQPINDTAHMISLGPDVSTFKAGSTVPVKFYLTDANGNRVQAGSAQWITPQKGSATTQTVDETVFTDPATTGTLYKYDATAQQYIYNWSTKGVAGGFYYKIGVKFDDGQTYYTYISLR